MGEDCPAGGNNHAMNEWRELAERLVELDLTIEDLDAWATDPDDISELQRREELRDEIQLALRFRHMPRRLRRQLEEPEPVVILRRSISDPRD